MNFYNQTSKGYNELYAEEQLKKLNIIKDNIKINKTDLLLDVGCGTGISSQFDCKVVGVDTSFQLLKQNDMLRVNSFAENLPFKNNVFDFVVSLTAIHNFKNIEKSLKEIKRVGRKQFVFTILKRSKKFNEIEKTIEKHFKIKKTIEEDKDLVFFI